MLGEVHAGDFVLFGDPESHGLVDGQADDGCHDGGEGHDYHAGHQLGPELAESSAVEQSRRLRRPPAGDEPEGHGADDSRDQVHANHVQRVVVAPAVLQAHGQGGDHAGHQAKANGCHRGNVCACGGDGHQAGNDSGCCTQRGAVPVADTFYQYPAQQRRGRCGQGVDPDEAGFFGRACGSAVEAEPAEPKQRGTEHHQGDVVRALAGILAESAALAKDQGQNQTGHACVDVYDGAAGEVDGFTDNRTDGAVRAKDAPAPDPEGDGAYTSVTHTGTKTNQALNLARSAMAPEIRATVMIAKVAPYPAAMKPSVPINDSMPNPSAGFPNSPAMLAPPPAIEFPQSTQTTATKATAEKLIIIMFKTLLARVIPP